MDFQKIAKKTLPGSRTCFPSHIFFLYIYRIISPFFPHTHKIRGEEMEIK